MPAPAPFSCSYTADVPGILRRLGCSLVLSTYQAGKVVLLSPQGEGLVQLARNFRRPMGIAVENGRMAIATRDEVVVLADSPPLGRGYPRKPEHYDAFFVPRASYYTGPLDLHDIAWIDGGRLIAVNTRFSCLCAVDDRFSFRPLWRPPFVSASTPEDRCHLNGLAVRDGRPAFAAALGATDEPEGWRADRLDGGVLVDIESGEVALRGLSMPHSPRLVGDELYLLQSATGELLLAEAASARWEVVTRVPGFARGLAAAEDYLFVGHSRIRAKHALGEMPISRSESCAGITMVHRASGRIAGQILYAASCEEIYDVQVLPRCSRPGILGVESDLHRRTVATPEGGYWSQPARRRP